MSKEKLEDKTIELLDKYLDADYTIFPMAPNKSSEEDIKELEENLGIKFPDEYILHLLGKDDEVLGNRGLSIEVKEEIWKRPKLYDVGEFWTFLYGLHTYTASKESATWMRLEVVGKEFLESTGLKAVPILKIIGDANVYCVDEKSQIVLYDHEQNSLEPLDMTFWDILEEELKELQSRKSNIVSKNRK